MNNTSMLYIATSFTLEGAFQLFRKAYHQEYLVVEVYIFLPALDSGIK